MSRLKLWYPPILAYHRIHPDGSKDTPTIAPQTFDRQMELLANRWQVVSLNQVVDWLEDKGHLPRRAVAVTFDDGGVDLFDHAFPILKARGIPATIFLIADYINQPGFLNGSQIKLMQQAGIQFGSHGLNHRYLPELSSKEIQSNLVGSKERLAKIGISAELLSYPAGGFNAEVLKAAETAGYRAACTTNRGIRRYPINRWALRRIGMRESVTSPLRVWLRANGFHGINRRLRSPS